MFDQKIPRIGFACKFMHSDQSQKPKILEEIQRPLNTKATTITWLNKQTRHVAEERLWQLMKHNIASIHRLVKYVSDLPENCRMVRLGSDILPAYTENNWSYFWRQPDVVAYCEKHFAKVGETAREKDVRLSFHPGQFVVLASDRPEVVNNSIEEFEYHVDMARWMGYGGQFQDFKINVHIAGKQGPAGIKNVLPRLSPEARNTITIENDEMSWGIEDSLELQEHCALVLDIHHHFIRSQGEYILPTDDRFKRMIDSWRGVRPVIHYSVSREEYIREVPNDELPNYQTLIELGYPKTKLRAHSDWYTNDACNDWALSFLEYSDIMSESKMKNLASLKLYEYWKNDEIRG